MHDLARAYGDLIVVTEYNKTFERIKSEKPNSDTFECFELLFRLDALTRINTNLATWLEVGYFNQNHAQIVRNQISLTLKALKRHIVSLTYGFAPSEDLTDSMLAPSDGDLYNSVISRVYSAPKAFER